MTIKKLTVIAAAGAVLLAGALGISMKLTGQNEMEMEVSETPAVQNEITDDTKTLGDMENTPLYYDETKKLLLPLRNVMEGLGGSVAWNPETKMTEVTYRGRTLELQAGNQQARLNGYDVMLPEAAEIINGCLYVDESLLAAYYTDDVDFNTETRQVTLLAKDNTVPVVAMNILQGEKDGREYVLEVPVVIGLNDSHFEKNLNAEIAQEMQNRAEGFLVAEQSGEAFLLDAKVGMCTKDFISLYWEGTKGETTIKFAKNIDLMGQRSVTLTELLEEAALQEVKAAAGEGWTEERFYLTAEGGLVVLRGSNENCLEMYHWTTEGKALMWKKEYKTLLQK